MTEEISEALARTLGQEAHEAHHASDTRKSLHWEDLSSTHQDAWTRAAVRTISAWKEHMLTQNVKSVGCRSVGRPVSDEWAEFYRSTILALLAAGNTQPTKQADEILEAYRAQGGW